MSSASAEVLSEAIMKVFISFSNLCRDVEKMRGKKKILKIGEMRSPLLVFGLLGGVDALGPLVFLIVHLTNYFSRLGSLGTRVDVLG